MFVLIMPESSIFAFSAASLRRCIAVLSFLRSMPVFVLEGLDHPVHDLFVKVVAAQTVVACGCEHLEHAVRDLKQRDVERAAAQVEYEYFLVYFLSMP